MTDLLVIGPGLLEMLTWLEALVLSGVYIKDTSICPFLDFFLPHISKHRTLVSFDKVFHEIPETLPMFSKRKNFPNYIF